MYMYIAMWEYCSCYVECVINFEGPAVDEHCSMGMHYYLFLYMYYVFNHLEIKLLLHSGIEYIYICIICSSYDWPKSVEDNYFSYFLEICKIPFAY